MQREKERETHTRTRTATRIYTHTRGTILDLDDEPRRLELTVRISI